MVIKDREFIENAKKLISKSFTDTKVAEVFERCMKNTLDTTIKIQDDETFILTGDIPAMWLRDSVCQIRPFLLFAKDHEEIQEMLIGLVKKQMKLINIDPYANAFNETSNGKGHQDDKTEMSPHIWERKYEIDSLCYPIQLAYLLWQVTGRTEHFSNEFKETCKKIVELWKVEQNHEAHSPYRFEREIRLMDTDTLTRDGKGSLTGYTGMTWSGFRPSDDACTYGYLVPSNMFATLVLGYLEEIMSEVFKDDALLEQTRLLKTEIESGIENFAVIKDDTFGEIYAYEVDGLGNHLLMDDANVPSLLSLPFLNYCDSRDVRYQNTRAFILSSQNPYFFKGKIANGVGSPHTPSDAIWPIALSIQGLTSRFESEKRDIVSTLLRTDAGTGLMHESFNVNDPSDFTREWFSWANMMYCELVLDIVGIHLSKLLK